MLQNHLTSGNLPVISFNGDVWPQAKQIAIRLFFLLFSKTIVAMEEYYVIELPWYDWRLKGQLLLVLPLSVLKRLSQELPFLASFVPNDQ